MPQYFYKCACGHGFKEVRPCSESKLRPPCPKCGEKTERDFIGEQSGVVHVPGNWPMKSDAMAVHPDQIGEAQESSVRKGVPTQFDRDGRPILTSAAHRKKFCEAYGYWAKNAGHSDPVRK
jgi:putative FmdB family regulatory protein